MHRGGSYKELTNWIQDQTISLGPVEMDTKSRQSNSSRKYEYNKIYKYEVRLLSLKYALLLHKYMIGNVVVSGT